MFKEVLKNTNKLYKEKFKTAFSTLFLWILTYAFIGQIWEHALTNGENASALSGFLSVVFHFIFSAFLLLASLNILLGNSPYKSINLKVLFFYLFISMYILLAGGLGLMLFIIPGVFVFTTSFLFIIFILDKGQGPIESIESSIDLIKDSFLKLTLLLILIYGITTAITGIVFWGVEHTGKMYNFASMAANIAAYIIEFYLSAFTVSLYFYYTQHNKALNANGQPQAAAY